MDEVISQNFIIRAGRYQMFLRSNLIPPDRYLYLAKSIYKGKRNTEYTWQ